MEEFKYLGTNLTNQNSVHKEIKSTLNSGSILLSFGAEPFCLPVCYLKNIKIKVYRTIILPVFCMGVELGLLH
jgi:hypothetical protein